MGTVMANSLSKNLKEAMQSPDAPDLSSLDPTLAQQMGAFANPQTLMNKPLIEQTQASLPTDIQPVFEKLIASMRDILGTTLSHVFLTGTLVLVVAFVLVFFLKEIPLRTSNQVAAKSTQSDGDAKLATAAAKE
ncbi:hypothetical protein D3C76_1276220 [compost metagenome]